MPDRTRRSTEGQAQKCSARNRGFKAHSRQQRPTTMKQSISNVAGIYPADRVCAHHVAATITVVMIAILAVMASSRISAAATIVMTGIAN